VKTKKLVIGEAILSALFVLNAAGASGGAAAQTQGKKGTQSSVSGDKAQPISVQKNVSKQAAVVSSSTVKAQPGPAGPGKLVPADLEYMGHECHILIPGDFSLQEFVSPSGKIFCFNSPWHSDKTRAVINVNIIPPDKKGECSSERALMDAMLDAHRKSLKNYKEVKEANFSNNGHEFKGYSYSGATEQKKNEHGFVFLTQDKTTFFILFGQDEEPYSTKSLPLLLNSAKGCEIKKK